MKISAYDGSIIWDRRYREWNDDGELAKSNLLDVRELPDGRLAMAGSIKNNWFDGLLLITDADGCLTPDCGNVQIWGDYVIPDFIYENNVWHVIREYPEGSIVDSYSYTFASDTVVNYGGVFGRELLKSIDNGLTWIGTGRYYRNGGGVLAAFETYESPVFPTSQYDFLPCCRFVRIGEVEHRPPLMTIVTLLDGSEKLRFYNEPSLACSDPPEMIEHVGLVNADPFFPISPCSADTLTRVTCLVKDGLVIYANPDYAMCLPVGVDDLGDDYHYSIVPNPANDYISIESTSTIRVIKLYSIKGQLLLESSNSNTLDTSSLESGIYMIYVTNSGGLSNNKLIVIE